MVSHQTAAGIAACRLAFRAIKAFLPVKTFRKAVGAINADYCQIVVIVFAIRTLTQLVNQDELANGWINLD